MTLDETYGPNLTPEARHALKSLRYLNVLDEYESVEGEAPTVADLVRFLSNKLVALGRGDPLAVSIGRLMPTLEEWADEQKLRAESNVLAYATYGNALCRTVSNEHPTYIIETSLLKFEGGRLNAEDPRQWVYDARTKEVRAAA